MPDTEINYVRMSLEELNPAGYNPRTIGEEAFDGLRANIEEFGLVQPIVWNKRTGNVVGGHQRLEVLKGEGVVAAMVCQVDLPLGREKALNVALNNPHITGEYDESLQDLLQEIQQDDRELFRDIHLDKLLVEEVGAKIEVESLLGGEGKELRSKPGSLWILGDHRLVCGSPSDHTTVMRLIQDDAASCLWTDPPYGKKPDGIDIDNLLSAVFQMAYSYVLGLGAAAYVCYPHGHKRHFVDACLQASCLKFRQDLIWAKNVLNRAHNLDYCYQHEPIWYGFKPGDEKFGRKERLGWFGGDSQGSVFIVDRALHSPNHPSRTPVELVERMLVNSSRPGDFVYDPFAGSGVTLMACEELGRKCLGIEIEPKYCDGIVSRWESTTGFEAEHDESQCKINGLFRNLP